MSAVIGCIMQSGDLARVIVIVSCSNWIVDRAEVGCQLPICQTLQLEWWELYHSHQWRQWITFLGGCWLSAEKNEVEWRQVAESDDNENSCDKAVMDVGSFMKNIVGRCVTWISLVWLHTDRQKAHPCWLLLHTLLLSPANRTDAAMCRIKQLSFRSVWTCFKAFQVQTERNKNGRWLTLQQIKVSVQRISTMPRLMAGLEKHQSKKKEEMFCEVNSN